MLSLVNDQPFGMPLSLPQYRERIVNVYIEILSEPQIVSWIRMIEDCRLRGRGPPDIYQG